MRRRLICLTIAVLCVAGLHAQQLTERELQILRALVAAIEGLPTAPTTPPTPVPPAPASLRLVPGDNLQAALTAAKPGDVIELGGLFVGSFLLPPKAGYVTLRGGGIRGTQNEPALGTMPGASYWRLQGLTLTADNPAGTILRIGSGTQTAAQVPHHFILEDLIVKGDPVLGQKRGIEANGADIEIRRLRCTDIKIVGQDTQCILGWNGPGPILIEDSYLEAAGENIMFGGADPSIPNLRPCDITIRNNDLTKPMAWKGTNWLVKNLFELKNACRVLFENNRLSNNWLQGQTGYAIVLKSTNQDGNCPWCETSDVRVVGNTLTNVSAGLSLNGRPEAHPAIAMSRVTVADNHITTNSQGLQGDGRCLSLANVANVTVEHNTCANDGGVALYFGESGINTSFVLRRNILVDRCGGDCWGIMGSGSGEGINAILKWAPGAVYAENLIVTPTPWLYGPATQNRLETVMPADTTGYGVRR